MHPVVIVTGAAGGIGFELVRSLLEEHQMTSGWESTSSRLKDSLEHAN